MPLLRQAIALVVVQLITSFLDFLRRNDTSVHIQDFELIKKRHLPARRELEELSDTRLPGGAICILNNFGQFGYP